MRQDISSQPALKVEDNWSQCLPGFRLTHTIYLVSDVNLDVVARAAAHLKNECTPVSQWTMVKRGNLLEQRIVLSEISERQASLLREHLLTLEDVLRVRLEHRFVRRSSNFDSMFSASTS